MPAHLHTLAVYREYKVAISVHRKKQQQQRHPWFRTSSYLAALWHLFWPTARKSSHSCAVIMQINKCHTAEWYYMVSYFCSGLCSPWRILGDPRVPHSPAYPPLQPGPDPVLPGSVCAARRGGCQAAQLVFSPGINSYTRNSRMVMIMD